MGMVFQDYALFPHLTVAANVGFGLGGKSRADKSLRVDEILRLVGTDRIGRSISAPTLREANSKELQLAAPSPHSHSPCCWMSPSATLMPACGQECGPRWERYCVIGGVATVIVTHDREEAFSLADRIAVMNFGRIEQIDRPGAIFRSPATPFVARITGRRRLSGRPDRRGTGDYRGRPPPADRTGPRGNRHGGRDG